MSSVISGVFAAAGAVFAVLALLSARKASATAAQLAELLRAIERERTRIAVHDTELDQITATLRKLSGRIGAARKQNSADDAPPDSPAADYAGYKARLRAKVGLVPGKPPPKIG